MHQACLNVRIYIKHKINKKSLLELKHLVSDLLVKIKALEIKCLGQSDIYIADKIKGQMVTIVPKAFFLNLKSSK